MKPDATINDAITLLNDPKAYLTGVLVHMRSCYLAYGSAFLRIGASRQATGQYPNYRVIYHKAGAEKIYGSFIDSGKALAEPYDKVVPGAWSTASTEMNEVIAIATPFVGK